MSVFISKKQLSVICKIVFAIMLVSSMVFFVACEQEPGSQNEQLGSIQGHAFYSNGDDHSGIVLTLDKTDGIRAITESDGSRAIVSLAKSNEDGSFAFYNLEPGTYTIYASSNDSVEKAVSTNVVVKGEDTVTAEDLHLTATGSLAGYVTIDGAEIGNAGVLVSVASTSYMATTGDNGYFCITGIPAGTGYSLIAVKGSYMTIVGAYDVEALKVSVVKPKDLSSDDIESGNNSLIWKGSYAEDSALANPKRNWAYFNTTDGCSYIFDGSDWTLLALKGDKGEQGEQGIQGEKGDKGDTGAQGPQGEQGIQGETGATGATGATGSAGSDGTSITWKGELNEEPENPGLYWAYYNSTDGCSYLFDGTHWTLLALKGDKGDQGEQGEQGIQGEKGDKGDTGAQGPQGETGDQGPQGAAGTAGTDGVSIIWLGSFEADPENPARLNAYYNTET